MEPDGAGLSLLVATVADTVRLVGGQSPEGLKHFSVAFCLAVEIIVPFFIWAPRRVRLIAAALMIFLQLAIAITGNYCFFNLLTIALCLLLIDDSAVFRMEGRAPASPASQELRPPNVELARCRLSTYAAVIVIIVTLPVNAWLIFEAFKPGIRPTGTLGTLYTQLEAFRILNGYGLFRVMTKERGEIVHRGHTDGVQWQPRIQMEAGRCETPTRVVRATPATARLADVVCRLGKPTTESVVPRLGRAPVARLA